MSTLQALTISNDGFAFNATTGESYTLNTCARVVLHRLRTNETQDQIVQAIVSEFGIAQSVVERDVADFFQQLRTLGLAGANS
jgi:hypothetical protein